MDSTPRTPPVLIVNSVNELFGDCSHDENGMKWQDLEHFWGEEKHRLQDGGVDGSVKRLSSSLEDHLLHDDVLYEPQQKDNSENDERETKRLRGDAVSDIPTTYTVRGFKSQELIAIGTYVDKDIIPGFRYKVRKNLSDEYLFDGKVKYLENIGQGYGKRITFEGDSLNENENYFWSDSSVNGYGFTFQAISKDDIFNIFDTKTGQVIGRILINDPSLKDDVISSTSIGERGYVEKEVEVHFSCDVILNDMTNKQNLFVENTPVHGKATVVRESSSSKAKIHQILLNDFIVDSCLLVAEE